MDNIKKYEPLWGAWHVESLIGEGAFGKVYQIRRQEQNKAYYSAVKIISLPQKNFGIQPLESKGLDKNTIHNFYRSLVSNISSEIALMSQFNNRSYAGDNRWQNSDSHILSFEDYKIYEHPYSSAWDILIRMELLQPLSYHIHHQSLSPAEVVNLGIHICRALELFHHNNIIHKDIKPTNIFITRRGTFKLGDFGIDRPLRRTVFGASKKRSYAAMAPEVFKSEKCDSSTDIYSLGILMYSLLNQKRTPFLPSFPQPITPNHYKNAFIRRINGEQIPALVGINPELNALLLKACAYSRANRFYGPAEMRKALEMLTAAAVPLPQYSSQTVNPEGPQYFRGREPIPGADSHAVHTRPATHAIPTIQTGPITHPPAHTGSAIPTEPTAHKNKNNAIPSSPPLQEAKTDNKGPFSSINRKHLPLIASLASALVLIALIAVFVNTLTIKYGISINGKTDIILSDKEEAQAVLDELEAYYTNLASSASIDISSFSYEETINVTKARAPASEVKDKDEALQALINGQNQIIEYTVAQGETIQKIAQKYNVTTEAIITENEELAITADTLQPKDPLTEGATIKLAVAQPYLHVVIEGAFQTTEEIDIEIKSEEQDTLLQNTSKVQQEGEKGLRDATYAIVLKNNVPAEKTILKETIHKQMIPKIVLEGSRPPRPGADSEQLKYIIQRESTGNVYATNGAYKGLGQLLDKYYQTYVGMSYAETLQQPNPYAVQVDAMLGYIYARYSSIEDAYNHWVQNHWY